MTNPRDIIRRRALEYHMREDRGSSCGHMAVDMDLILSGLVGFGEDARLYVTAAGQDFLAQGIAGPQDAPEHRPNAGQEVV